jgi:two-component system, OmpR family, sensor kinase
VPIRARLTAALAVSMSLVLILTGVFVYLRVESDLDQAINDGLRSRADDVAALVTQADSGLTEAGAVRLGAADESFAQVLTIGGEVVDSTPGASRAALTPAEARSIDSPAVFDQRAVKGIEGDARLLARPVAAQDTRLVVVVGTSISDRGEALDGLLTAFGIGIPVAVLLCSGLGYALVRLGFSPVEALRRRAERITLSRGGERLPLPGAEDEIRRLGETLNSMLARLEASFERERAFVADASHELRTPLAVLRAELEVTLDGGGYDAEVGASLRTAVAEVDQLSRLAEDLLLLARSQDGELGVRRESVEVRELLESVVGRFRDQAAARELSLNLDAPAGIVAELDPLAIRQAVSNLIDNAIRHGAGPVEVTARSDGASVEIRVEDRGPGFPADFAGRAFERFTRADPGRARGGAGLGLAIVQGIAAAHGGDVRIDRGRQAGASVVITLPLSEHSPAVA